MGIVGVIAFLFLVLTIVHYLAFRAGSSGIESEGRELALVLCVFWLSLPLLMVIDNVQEKPQIIYPMILLTAVILGLDSKPQITKPQ